MFERFTEKARRSVFFARYEASVSATRCIESEHLLLGFVREWPELAERFPIEDFRLELAKKFPEGARVSTSVDMPLSHEAKRVLSRGADEADRRGRKEIDVSHLTLGVIHESEWIREWLLNRGIGIAAIEKLMSGAEAPATGQSPSRRLTVLTQTARTGLLRFSEEEANATVGKDRRSRKESLGHLIDCAVTHHHWAAQALSAQKGAFPGYPQHDWAAAMKYATTEWVDLVELWTMLSQSLAHAIEGMKEGIPVRVGIEPPTSFDAVIQRYIKHLESRIAEILTLGHST